jgi:hypothetical protein
MLLLPRRAYVALAALPLLSLFAVLAYVRFGRRAD